MIQLFTINSVMRCRFVVAEESFRLYHQPALLPRTRPMGVATPTHRMGAALLRIAGATTMVRTANGLSVNDPIPSPSMRYGLTLRPRIHNNFSMVIGR